MPTRHGQRRRGHRREGRAPTPLAWAQHPSPRRAGRGSGGIAAPGDLAGGRRGDRGGPRPVEGDGV